MIRAIRLALEAVIWTSVIVALSPILFWFGDQNLRSMGFQVDDDPGESVDD